MILLTPKFSESFDNSSKDDVGMLEMDSEKDCFGSCFTETECSKLYNEEYIEVFSPTVFETVEIYTSDKVDAASSELESSEGNPAVNISLGAIDTTVSTLENLEPGTYTLDVLESSDFDFDAVFVDSATFQSRDENGAGEAAGEEDTERKSYKLRNCRSTRKPLASKNSTRNVTARDFLHNFSKDLRDSEVKEEESKSLSWLLDFKISSIFHPVENDADNSDKSKKKSNDAQRKPRYTYTELIEQALKENGELTVSGIYNWISKHYPYYQQNDDRWKNSVRHNLSINPQFRKGKKASQGAGHFWNISDSSVQSSESNANKSPLPHETNKTMKSITDIINQIDEEVLAATKSIQESENMDFTDVSLHDAAEQQLQIDSAKGDSSFVHISRNDLENLWESTHDTSDQRFTSFSPLIREITEDSSNMEDENFLIQDINNSICLGDELFGSELQSPYYEQRTELAIGAGHLRNLAANSKYGNDVSGYVP